MRECACYRQGRTWPFSRADYDDNKEARGYVAMSAARGPVVIYGALYATVALNAFAASLADCEGNVLSGSLKASSVVSLLATIEGVMNSILSPFFGGFADLTPHRKLSLGVTFSIIILTLVLQGIWFISEDSTLADPNDPSQFLPRPTLYSDELLVILLIIFLTQTVIYELSALMATSYSPELTLDEVKQAGYIADSFAVNNGSQLVLVLVLTGISLAAGLNAFESGLAGAFICAAWCSSLALYGFPKLGARREVNKNLDSRCFGVVHLGQTVWSGFTKYPDIMKFLVSWMLVAAAVSSSVALATTYFQFHMGFSSLEIQVLLGTALVLSVPGSVLSRVWVKSFGVPVKKLYIIVSSLYALSFLVAPFLLTSTPIQATGNTTFSQFGKCPFPLNNSVVAVEPGPGGLYISGGFVVLWGLLLGHIYPLNIAIYSLLIPGGEESSWFGIKVTFSKVLTWLPPLAFTTINEIGSLQFAIMPVGAMFAIGAFVAFFIDMDQGMIAVKDTLHLRKGEHVKDPNARLDSLAIELDGKTADEEL